VKPKAMSMFFHWPALSLRFL